MESQQLYHDVNHALFLLTKALRRLPNWTESQWEYWFSRYRENQGIYGHDRDAYCALREELQRRGVQIVE